MDLKVDLIELGVSKWTANWWFVERGKLNLKMKF